MKLTGHTCSKVYHQPCFIDEETQAEKITESVMDNQLVSEQAGILNQHLSDPQMCILPLYRAVFGAMGLKAFHIALFQKHQSKQNPAFESGQNH